MAASEEFVPCDAGWVLDAGTEWTWSGGAQGESFALQVDRPGWLAVAVEAVGIDGAHRSAWIEAHRGACSAAAESFLGRGLIWVGEAGTVFLRTGLVAAKEPMDLRLTTELFPAVVGRIADRTGDGSGDGGDGGGDGGEDTEEEDDEVLPLMSPEDCPDAMPAAAGSWTAVVGGSPLTIGRIAGRTGDGSGDGGDGGGEDTEEEDDEVLPLVAPPVKCPASAPVSTLAGSALATSLGIDCGASASADDFSFCARGLRSGRLVKGSFDGTHGADQDFFRFSVNSVRTVEIHAAGVAGGRLLDALGRPLAEMPADDGALFLAARLPRGEYFLQVADADGLAGDYQVMLRSAAHR